MNFHEAQDQARRRSGRLLLLFALAVAALVLVTNLFLGLFLAWFRPGPATGPYPAGPTNLDPAAMPWQEHALISALVVLVIGLGTLWRWFQLRGGGRAVAEAMGARLVPQDSDDPGERRALNVVAEMALASAVPVPPLYLLDNSGINAFAAGHGADDLVVALTRGAVEQLSRDELQGVVGHEFSHLLHGDCRLNMRLVAVLYGVLAIGLIGEGLMHGGSHSRRDRGNTMVLGLGLFVLGYAGLFFGKLIKAAVSRQREYLADASAVQYTRNPEGIANALKRLAGQGSAVPGSHAQEISHMWFGTPARLRGWFATHPPLPERIRALEPGWDGSLPPARTRDAAGGPATVPLPAPLAGLAAADPLAFINSAPVAAAGLTAAVASGATEPEAHDLAAARATLAQLPADLTGAAANATHARGLVHALLLASADANTRASQLQAISDRVEPLVLATIERLGPAVAALPGELRRQLLDLCLPSLKQLSPAQYQEFRRNLRTLVLADNTVTLAEWCLWQRLHQGLGGWFDGHSRPPTARLRQAVKAPRACGDLLAALAWAGNSSRADAQAAWANGLAALNLDAAKAATDGQLPSAADPNCQRLGQAVKRLRRLYPLARPALLKACVAVVEHDHLVTAEQLDLLAALAACLDCPLPPHVLHGEPSA